MEGLCSLLLPHPYLWTWRSGPLRVSLCVRLYILLKNKKKVEKKDRISSGDNINVEQERERERKRENERMGGVGGPVIMAVQ